LWGHVNTVRLVTNKYKPDDMDSSDSEKQVGKLMLDWKYGKQTRET